MKKEKPTTKTCKHCKTEMPIDEKVCPNCGKKQPNGCLIAIIALVVVIVILALPFGSSDDTKEPDTEPTKTSKTDTKTPSEDDIQKAIEEDNTIFDLVVTSENLTNTLLIAVSNTESGTTTTLDV